MIDTEFIGLKEARAKFDPRLVDKATTSAITKVTKKARTILSKEMRRSYRFTAREIAKTATIIKPPGESGIIKRILLYSGKRPSLAHFKSGRPKMVKTKRGRRYAAKVKIRKNQKAKVASSGFFGRAQVSMSLQIFQRKDQDDPQSKLEKMTAPSISQVVRGDGFHISLNNFVAKEFPAQFSHEINFYLAKARGDL